MKLSVVAIICAASFAIAADMPKWLLEERLIQAQYQNCVAKEFKKYKQPVVQLTKRDPNTEAEADGDSSLYNVEIVERAPRRTKEYRCEVQGHLKRPVSGGASQNHITFQNCANFCLCKFTEDDCRTFSWVETNSKKQTGFCQTYPLTLDHMGYRKKPKADEPNIIFYNRHCFHRHDPTPSQTISDMPGQETPKPQRRDTVGNMMVDALLGV